MTNNTMSRSRSASSAGSTAPSPVRPAGRTRTTADPSVRAAVFSSASDDWPTPQAFFDTLEAEFGFVVDACASDSNRKAGAYYATAWTTSTPTVVTAWPATGPPTPFVSGAPSG